MKKDSNDLRWFIWTIVFLVVSGVALVSYILLTDYATNAEDVGGFIVHQGSIAPKK